MDERQSWRRLSYALIILFISISITLIEYVDYSHKSFIADGLQTRAKEELSVIRSELEAAVVSDIYVAHSLSTIVTLNPIENIRNWEAIASNIILEGRHIRIIGLAPDDVIEYIYPFPGNEAALGLDYRTIPEQWESVKLARELREIFIAGPIELVQGGQALVARIPIFLDPPFYNQYWG